MATCSLSLEDNITPCMSNALESETIVNSNTVQVKRNNKNKNKTKVKKLSKL